MDAARDMMSAILALNLASSMLEDALMRFEKKDYTGTMEESRNAVRVASSAILYKDGIVSDSFETTISHLQKEYPGVFPLDEWRRMENFPSEGGYGIYHALVQALRLSKKADEESAKVSIAVAQMFINSARTELD